MRTALFTGKSRLLGVALSLLTVMALVNVGQLAAKDGGTKLKARLAGAAIGGKTPEGSAEFRSQTKGSSLEVEVEHVNLPDGTVLTVSITRASATAAVVTTVIGKITLKLGEGELELESEHGTIVPAVQKGDVVTVANAAGAAIVVGSF